MGRNLERQKEYKRQWDLDNRERVYECRRRWQIEDRKNKKNVVNKYKLSKGCSVCGYNKYAEALVFHHSDDNNKKFDIARGISHNMSLKKIEKEMKKCVLLCQNCHAELHARRRNGEN